MPTNSSSNMIYEIDLYKDNQNNLGMALTGDADSGIFVKSLQPESGSAGRSGRIHIGLFRSNAADGFLSSCVIHFVGDRLLSVNGKNVNGMSVQDVADALGRSSNPCRLRLARRGTSTLDRQSTLPHATKFGVDAFLEQQNPTRYSSNPSLVGSCRSSIEHGLFCVILLGHASEREFLTPATTHASTIQ